jgi:hypothetical protein
VDVRLVGFVEVAPTATTSPLAGLYEGDEFWPMRSLLTELVKAVETVLTRFEVFVR